MGVVQVVHQLVAAAGIPPHRQPAESAGNNDWMFLSGHHEQMTKCLTSVIF